MKILGLIDGLGVNKDAGALLPMNIKWSAAGMGALSFSNTLIHISFTGAIFGEDETEFIVLYVFRSRFLKRWFCI